MVRNEGRRPRGTPRRVRRSPARPGARRPRTLAGHGTAPRNTQERLEPAPPEAQVAHEQRVLATTMVRRLGVESHRSKKVVDTVTVVLACVIVALLALGIWEVVHLSRDERPVMRGALSTGSPVQVDDATATAVVARAADDLERILSVSYRGYDPHVERAAAVMTPDFAEDYRLTAQGGKRRYLRDKVEVSVHVRAAGVVTATPQQVVALLFFTQSSTAAGAPAQVARLRAKVTMTRVGDEWLVSQMEAV